MAKKWPEIATNGQKWPKNGQRMAERSTMAPKKKSKIVENGKNGQKMVKDGQKMVNHGQNGQKMVKTGPNGQIRSH